MTEHRDADRPAAVAERLVNALLFLPRRAVRPVLGPVLRPVLRPVRAGADVAVRALVAAVVDRIDLDQTADRVDVNRIADRVDVHRVADRVDVNAVARRVDVDAVAARVDVDAVAARIDLVALTARVLAEVDVQRIVRDAGSGMTQETLDAVRERGVRADDAVDRLARRLLRRNGAVSRPAKPT